MCIHVLLLRLYVESLSILNLDGSLLVGMGQGGGNRRVQLVIVLLMN